MQTFSSVPWWSHANHLVAIEFQGRKTVHIELAKLEKYPQLYIHVTSPAPSYIYGHVHHDMGFHYREELGPMYLDLRTVPGVAGHMLWEYLSQGTFTRLQGNPSDKKQDEYFKSIVHVHAVADRFNIDGLRSDTAKEIFRKAQGMGLMELVKLLEEANYHSKSFPKFSEYLEKRLIGSALSYGDGDSHKAFPELRTQQSLSLAQMLLKAITEISDVGCIDMGKNLSNYPVIDRMRIGEKHIVSEFLGDKETKKPTTMWMKPRSETKRTGQSVGSRLFSPAAKEEERSGMKDNLGQPMQREALPLPSFYSPNEPAYIPPSLFLPSLSHQAESNEFRIPERYRYGPKTWTYQDPSSSTPRAKTQSELNIDREREIMRLQKIRQPNHLFKQRLAAKDLEERVSKLEQEDSNKNSSHPATSSGFSSQPTKTTETGTPGEAKKSCNQPVTPIGPVLKIPEYRVVPYFDAPLKPFSPAPDAMKGDSVEVEEAIDWVSPSEKKDAMTGYVFL